jgi:hypothetical protein
MNLRPIAASVKARAAWDVGHLTLLNARALPMWLVEAAPRTLWRVHTRRTNAWKPR